jgi:dTDP-4-amino-4,6-dideoxygalactose transaminase
MNIPFLDLKTPHQELEEELIAVFRECIRTASFVGGAQVQGFEEEFAQFCETKYCVAVNSGTDALRFALIAAGIGLGDEVITVPNTFIATTEAISQTGATPVFIDIDERTYNMDPNKLEDYLKSRQSQGARRKGSELTYSINSSNPMNSRNARNKPRPRAVLPVHLYGQPADMGSILEIADRYGLIVIEDACQAHGALYYSKKDGRWKKAGSMGLAAAFSFYPGKNLGACGEGGAVTTNDESMAQKIRMLRDHGQAKKYYHDFEGYNGRLDAIQTGILRVKLKHLSEWNEKRRRNASLYTQLLTLDTRHSTLNTEYSSVSEVSIRNQQSAINNRIIPPYEPSWSKAVYHLYIIRTAKRDDLQKYLLDNGISTGLHYPIPLHLQNAYKNLKVDNGNYPVTEKVSQEILSLPMFPSLTEEQIKYVVHKIKEFIHS